MRKFHKVFCLLLCLAMLAGYAPLSLALEQGRVIEISCLEDFLTFAENCRLDSYSRDKHFLLTVDIDLTDVDFQGIPTFGGTFDGSHHIIKGLKISHAGSVMGLFRYVQESGIVRDLSVEGTVNPTGTAEQAGGIAGNNAGKLENCSFTGTVSGTQYVGGIAGYNEISGHISTCGASGIVSGKHFVGGVAGNNAGTISYCRNNAGINTTAQQNDIDISDITLDTLLNAESAAAATDIGGIAGYSDGVIIGSKNHGTVGYPHMGYNLGGIAGVQAGYIADCENHGTVFGRKEVGGIAGQQEPQVIVRYDTDTLQILKVQLGVLSDLVKKASANGSANATKIRNLIYKLEKHISTAEDALEYLRSALENPRFEDLQSYLDALQTIRDSIDGIGTTLRKLYDAMDDTMSDLNADMQAITDQMAVIEQTLNNAEDHLGGKIFDISDEDTAEDIVSKIENCKNFGAVSGDLNAGGIVGAIAFENDLDPEKDITVVGSTTLNAIGSLRSVVTDCVNHAAITVKNQRAGGIVGYLSMGLIRNCVNTGSLDNAAADYIGGIAGDSAGFIRGCKVKCVLSGDMAVGGIAGMGTIASGCYAMVAVSGTEKMGAVFGSAAEPYADEEEPITGNFYLQMQPDIGGIDGISYEGNAQGLSQSDFLALQSECEIFSQVTVTFLADGEVVLQSTIPSGSAFADIPQVPAKDGYSGYWDKISQTDLSCVLFDVTFTAEYTAYGSTIQSDLSDEKGRPVLLLQGDFSMGASATVSVLQNFAALRDGQTLLQALCFTTEECICLQAGRMLLPADVDAEDLILMVRDSAGNWMEHVFRVDGSYIVFSLATGDDAVALLQADGNNGIPFQLLVAAGGGALFVLLIVCVVLCITKRKRSKK